MSSNPSLSEILLPKGYLSWSGMSTWCRSRESYRRHYYHKGDSTVTPAMEYGSKISDLLENHPEDPLVREIPKYMQPEYPFNVTVDGVPIYGKIDSWDPLGKVFLEYKTGIRPWDRVKVHKHEQLDFYAVATGARSCDLVWLQTEKENRTWGEMVSTDVEIKLTGKMEIFHRDFTEADITYMRLKIRRVAEEITADYKSYLATL